MSRFSCYSLALLAALTMTSGAYARVNHQSPSIQPGAHASAVGTSEADIRKQCADEARARWGTNSQEEPRLRREHLLVRSRRAQSVDHATLGQQCPGRPCVVRGT
jgi:hypothetical protein